MSRFKIFDSLDVFKKDNTTYLILLEDTVNEIIMLCKCDKTGVVNDVVFTVDVSKEQFSLIDKNEFVVECIKKHNEQVKETNLLKITDDDNLIKLNQDLYLSLQRVISASNNVTFDITNKNSLQFLSECDKANEKLKKIRGEIY